MSDKTSKIISWVLYVLMAISIVFSVLFYTNIEEHTSSLMTWGYIMIAISLLVVIISPIFGLIVNPSSIGKMLIAIGVVVVVCCISYFTTGNSYNEMQLEAMELSESGSHLISTGMLITYIALALAILSVVFSSVYKYFK